MDTHARNTLAKLKGLNNVHVQLFQEKEKAARANSGCAWNNGKRVLDSI